MPDLYQEPAPKEREQASKEPQVIFGSEIAIGERKFDDELIEDLISRKSLVSIFGKPGAGKTFFAAHMAASIAEAQMFFGRHVVGGLVLYLAAESADSVITRMGAIKSHTGWALDRLAVVHSPVNFHTGEGDSQGVIRLAERLEESFQMEVALVIGDTLAALTGGANENASADMGKVLDRINEIRDQTGAAFVMVHHTGKDEARGMRGWSGLNAAVDTEIEVQKTTTGVRVAEVKKQRDLSSEGEQHAFKLHHVKVGTNRWGNDRTTCVVAPAEAPPKQTSGQTESDIKRPMLAFIGAHPGCRHADIKTHLAALLGKKPKNVGSTISKQIPALIEAGVVIKEVDRYRLATTN